MRKAIAGLRQNQPDGALLLPNAFEPALLSTLAGIPQRVGYATDGRGWLLTQAVEPPPAHQATHEMDRFAGLLAPLEIGAPDESDLGLSPSPDIDRRATAILPEQGEVLGLVPGAANGPAKRWPARFYGGLASACAERLGAQAALLGGPTDRVVARKVRESSHSPCINLVGSDLLDLAAALCRCRVVVSNDTGAAHLAAALGRPTIVLFGPTDPARTCPRGERVQLVSAHASCQPCLSQECPLDHRCMERLSVETVFQAVADLWDVAA
jgi:heptosyltransferase-2